MSCHKWFWRIVNITCNQQIDCSKAVTDKQQKINDLRLHSMILVLQWIAKTITLKTDPLSHNTLTNKISKTKATREIQIIRC